MSEPVYCFAIHARGRSAQPYESGRATARALVARVGGIIEDGHYLKMPLRGIEVTIWPEPTEQFICQPLNPKAARAFRARWNRVARANARGVA